VRTTPNHWFWLRRAGRLKGSRSAPNVGKHRPVGDAQWVSYGFRDETSYAAVAIPHWPDTQAVLNLRATTRRAAREVSVTEDLALVLGLFMAEGHTGRGQVTWTLNKTEKHLAQFIQDVVRDVVPGKVSIYQRSSVLLPIARNWLTYCASGQERTSACQWNGWGGRCRCVLLWCVDGSWVTAVPERITRSLAGRRGICLVIQSHVIGCFL